MLIYTDLLTGETSLVLINRLHCILQMQRSSWFAGVAVGDEMIADSYEMKEVEDGFFFEVEGSVSPSIWLEHMLSQANNENMSSSSSSRMQWVTVGDVDVDIGANPSAEEADEGTESTNRKVVDIVDSFRLVVSISCNTCLQHFNDLVVYAAGAVRS